MDESEQMRLLHDMRKAQTHNSWEELKKSKALKAYLVFMLSFYVFLIVMMASMWEKPDSYVLPLFAILPCVLLFIPIVSAGLIMMMRYHEREFLLPLPISTKIWARYRFLFALKINIAVVCCVWLVGHLALFMHLSDAPMISLGFLSATLPMMILLLVFTYSIQELYRTLSPGNKTLFSVCMTLIALVVAYQGLSIFLEVLKGGTFEYDLFLTTFPLNIVVSPVAFMYLTISGTLPPLPIVVGTASLTATAIIGVRWAWGYEPGVLDEEAVKPAQEQQGALSREISSDSSWWRKHVWKRSPLDYPVIKEGNGALMERGFLMGWRSNFFIPLIFLGTILFTTSLFAGLGDFEGLGSVAIMLLLMMIFIATFSPADLLDIESFEIRRTMPWDPGSMVLHLVLPQIFATTLCVWGVLIFNLSFGIIGPELFIILFALLPLLTSALFLGSTYGFMWALESDDFSSPVRVVSAFIGAFLLMILTIFLVLLTHGLAGYVTDSALKFVFVIPVPLILIFFFIKGYEREWRSFAIVKKRSSRRKLSALGVSILLGGGIFLIGGDLPETFFGPPDVLTIDRDRRFIDKNLVFEDDVIITSSGSLTLVNCSVRFEADWCEFLLERGGELYITDCKLESSGVDMGYIIRLHGTARITDTAISDVLGNVDHPNVYGGIEIYSDDVVIENTTITQCLTNGVCIRYCSPTLKNVDIFACGDDGIEIRGGSPDISGCNFSRNYRGITMFKGSTPLFFNTTIMYNIGDGIASHDSTPALVDCDIIYNGGYGLRLEDSTPEVENVTLYGNYPENVWPPDTVLEG